MTPPLVLLEGESTIAWKKETYFLFGLNASIVKLHIRRKVGGGLQPPGSGMPVVLCYCIYIYIYFLYLYG